MRTGVIAKKLGMTRFFDEAGHPCAGDRAQPRRLPGRRPAHPDKDGYVALQLGAGAKKPKNTSKAMRGHFAKAAGRAQAHRGRVPRQSEDMLIDVGAEITADHFVAGQKVDVTGITVGKGFPAP